MTALEILDVLHISPVRLLQWALAAVTCTVIAESCSSNSRAGISSAMVSLQDMPELIKHMSTFNTVLVALDRNVRKMWSRGFYAFCMSITRSVWFGQL